MALLRTGRHRRGRRRAKRGPRLGGSATLIGLATLAVLVAGVVAATQLRPAPVHRKPLTPAAALQLALRATLATSFQVSGTISEGHGSGVQVVRGSLDLPRHLAWLQISSGPGSAPEEVVVVPGHTYQRLLAPADVLSRLPKGTRWVAEKGSLSGLVLGADNALSALVFHNAATTRITRVAGGPGRSGSYLATTPPAATTATGPVLPSNTERFTVDRLGQVAAVAAVSYTRTPFGQGGLAGVLATTASLRLSDFGAPVRVRPPPGDQTVRASVYDALLRAGLPAVKPSPMPRRPVGRQRSAPF
ncbi:MAG: hypothetical protein ACYCO3_08440 [Mycobacteriales bacterium]